MTYFISTGSKHFNMSSKERIRSMTTQRMQPSSFFLACDANHVTVTRLSIPAAMRAKGYSDVEALDGTLIQQVHCKSQKIKAKNTPCPESVAASLLLTLAMVAMTARPALQTITSNQTAALVVVVGGINAMRAQPLSLPKRG